MSSAVVRTRIKEFFDAQEADWPNRKQAYDAEMAALRVKEEAVNAKAGKSNKAAAKKTGKVDKKHEDAIKKFFDDEKADWPRRMQEYDAFMAALRVKAKAEKKKKVAAKKKKVAAETTSGGGKKSVGGVSKGGKKKK